MGVIMTALPWAVLAAFTGVAVHGYWRLARTEGGWRWRERGWYAPLIFTSAALATAAGLGILGAVPGSVLAVIPLAVIGARVSGVWRDAAKVKGPGFATAMIASLLAGRIRAELGSLLEDLRVLTGRERDCAPDAAGVPVVTRPRREPSTARPDPALGPAPVPEQVAGDLEAAGVAVPAAWAAVAERFASFEPEDGDDLRLFIAENAAGILTVAEVIGEQAEDFAAGIKLDPEFIRAQVAFADDFADTASAAARTIQVYDAAYSGAHEHVDGGGTLPEDARGWFGAGGPAEGGRAA
jgi:hypothetical protein